MLRSISGFGVATPAAAAIALLLAAPAGAQTIAAAGSSGGGSAADIKVGTTTVTGGAANQLLYDNAGVLGEVTKGNNCVYLTNGSGVPSCSTTLPSVITAGGPTGSATVAPIITYNAAGQLTAVSSATITPAVGSVTGLGTGVTTALGANVGSAGAFVVLGGALGTPISGTGTNITGIPNNNVNATTLATGTSVSLSSPREYYVCTSTCTVTPPVPAAGYEFCVLNDDNVATVITLAALGSSARYETTARTSYGTAGTGTAISGGAAGDKMCLLGRDSTHYLVASYTGTWTVN